MRNGKKVFTATHTLRKCIERGCYENGWKGRYEDVECRVEVEFDLEEAFSMASTALNNRNRKSVKGSGLVVVRAVPV